VRVKKGWKPGTTITFPHEGDQGPNIIPADFVFIVKDKEDSRFCRDGVDLIYTCPISLCKALTGTTVEIRTVDERLLHLPITDIVCPGYRKVVPEEGMPHSNNGDLKGNLIIEFDIQYPKSLSPDKKALIRKALPLR